MTPDELKSLRRGEIVVITSVDEYLCKYHNYLIGDQLIFSDINEQFVLFIRGGIMAVYFTSDIHNYIERKSKLERD
jgi:hypothetical protein